MPASKIKVALGSAPSARKPGRPKKQKTKLKVNDAINKRPSRAAERLLGEPIFELEKLGKG
jgi:hypothetical protein